MGKEGKHNAHKPSRNSELRAIYDRPLKEGTGLAPAFINGEYRGIPLTDDVRQRIAEYRALPSLVK